MMTLFLMVVRALGHLLGHPRMLQICPSCNSCPEFVELGVVFENLVVLVHRLGVQRLVRILLILSPRHELRLRYLVSFRDVRHLSLSHSVYDLNSLRGSS